MKHLAKLICLLAVLLLASPPAVQAGPNYYMQWDNQFWNVAQGGRLTGYWWDGTPSPATDISSRLKGGFWCVDDNDYINYSQPPMTVDVTSIGTGWSSSLARKGGLVATQFRNDHGSDGLTPQQRYKLAAALIAGYVTDIPGYSTGIHGLSDHTNLGDPVTSHDLDIQKVIWWTLDFQTYPGGPTAEDISSNSTRMAIFAAAKTWVLANQTDVRFNSWLLFSPPGAAGTTQAFLGEVPEPAFLGFLAVGLTGLYLARRRRLS
jgi:hypothetical protein